MRKSTTLKCDGPFTHSLKRTTPSKVSDSFRVKAQACFPEFNWSKVEKLCLSCKHKVEAGVVQPKKRGRKKSITTEQDAQVPASQSTTDPRDSQDCVFRFMDGVDDDVMNTDDDGDRVAANNTHATPVEFSVHGENFIEVDENMSCSQSSAGQGCSQESDACNDNLDMQLEDLNIFLERMRISPISKTTLYRPKEFREAWKASIQLINEKFSALSKGSVKDPMSNNSCEYCDCSFLELCDKYRGMNSKVEKFKILTSLPGRFTAEEIARESGCSLYTARQALELRRDAGCFTYPPPRKGKPIPEHLVTLVREFYRDDSVSRPSPKPGDTIAGLKKGDDRIERRYMMLNQRETYMLFKEKYPLSQIKKSKFYELRPRECVLPKNRPHHNVCLCVIHENFKFLYEAVGSDVPMNEFIASILCKPAREECAHGLCNDCPDIDKIYSFLETIEEEEVQYKMWKRTDGTDLHFLTVPLVDFQELFIKSLVQYITHDYVKVQQQHFIRHIKNEVLKNQKTLMITVDFAQNYSMAIQDAVQGYHWSGKQATIHPFCVNWYDQAAQKVLEKQYVVISDEMSHDVVTFNSFKRKVVSLIKVDFEDFDPKHIFYVSDGCSGQYKNSRNFGSLMDHFNDFGITAELEWIFTATAHGKGPCDRMAAIVKSTTRIHSLKHGNYITDAKQVFDFCVKKLGRPSIHFLYVSKEEVSADRDIFTERYKNTKKITGTRSYHHFVPLANGVIKLGRTGTSNSYHTFHFMRDYTLLLDMEDLDNGDFVCFVANDSLQVGMFVEKDDEYAEIQCMKITRSNFNLRWPQHDTFQNVPLVDLLMKVPDPVLANTGRYFTYRDDQIQTMLDKFGEWVILRQ